MVEHLSVHGRGRDHRPGTSYHRAGYGEFCIYRRFYVFASGLTGVVNAVYNQTDIVWSLDNSTTAMTGHQPHPGTGKTMMGVVAKVSIEKILEGIGVSRIVKGRSSEPERSGGGSEGSHG